MSFSGRQDPPSSLSSVLGERGALAQMLAHGIPSKSWSTTYTSPSKKASLRRPVLSSSSPGLYSHASHMGHYPFTDPQRDIMASVIHGAGQDVGKETGEEEEEAIPIGKPISKIRPQRNGRSRAERALEAELYAEAGRVAAAQAAAAAARKASMDRAPPASAYATLSTTAKRSRAVVTHTSTSTAISSTSSFTAEVPVTSFCPMPPPQPPPVKFKSVAFEVTLGAAPATSTTTTQGAVPASSPPRPAPHKANPAFFSSSNLPVVPPERTLLPSSSPPPPSAKSSTASTTVSPPSPPLPHPSAFDLAAGVLAEEAMAMALEELNGGEVEVGAPTESSFCYPSPPLPASPPLEEGEGESEEGGEDKKSEMGEGDSLSYEPPMLSGGVHPQQQQQQCALPTTSTFPPPPPLPSRPVWRPTSALPASTFSTIWEQAASYRSSFSHTEGAITMIRGVPPSNNTSSSSSSAASPTRSSTLIATLPGGGGKSRVGLGGGGGVGAGGVSSNPYQPPLDWYSNLRRDDPSLDITLHSSTTSLDYGGRRAAVTGNHASSVYSLASAPPPTTFSSSSAPSHGKGSSPLSGAVLDPHLTAVPKGGTPAYLKSIRSVIGEKVRADRVAAAAALQSSGGGGGMWRLCTYWLGREWVGTTLPLLPLPSWSHSLAP